MRTDANAENEYLYGSTVALRTRGPNGYPGDAPIGRCKPNRRDISTIAPSATIGECVRHSVPCAVVDAYGKVVGAYGKMTGVTDRDPIDRDPADRDPRLDPAAMRRQYRVEGFDETG